MKILFVVITAVFFVVACTSNRVASTPIASSISVSVSQSPILSAETQARLKKIQDDCNAKDGMVDINGHIITIGTPGLQTKEGVKPILDALHNALGSDFTNYTISFISD
jgi:hypothetical protein